MNLKDGIEFVGNFKIKSIRDDGTVEVLEEKNLIMDEARTNMAQLIGGVTSGSDTYGDPINKFVIGTLGHSDSDILSPIAVGEDGFTSARTSLFSEANASAYNYRIDFDPEGGTTVTKSATGKMYKGSSLVNTDSDANTVKRVVSDRTVTYTITIPTTNANNPDSDTSVIAFTEAALYASGEIFSMKTFAGRVKEDTVKLVIEWSIIF